MRGYDYVPLDSEEEANTIGIRLVAIPEPSSAVLLVVATLGAMGVRRIRRLKSGYEA